MKAKDFDAGRLDVPAFTQAGATLSAEEPLSAFGRLAAESAVPDASATVRWQARGETRALPGGAPVPWLHLRASATVPLVCQRCLNPVDTPLQADRWFRFADDEETAALEDEEAEEDVLAGSREFDLHALVEDELLMELPITPRHEACPVPVTLSAADADFDAEGDRPNPFAALEALRRKE
ncbi:MAG: DUF177 domain-containing protein [Xenophilus sp.]